MADFIALKNVRRCVIWKKVFKQEEEIIVGKQLIFKVTNNSAGRNKLG